VEEEGEGVRRKEMIGFEVKGRVDVVQKEGAMPVLNRSFQNDKSRSCPKPNDIRSGG